MSSKRSEFGSGIALGVGGTLLVGLVVAIALSGFGGVRPLRIHGSTFALPAERAEAAGLRMELDPTSSNDVVFTRGSERFTYTPPNNEFCMNPVVAADGRTAFALCADGIPNGWTYACVLRFDLPEGPLSGVRATRILAGGQISKLLDGKRAEVTAVRRVASSGKHLLLIVHGELPGSASDYTEGAFWYDVDADTLAEPDR